MLQKDQQQQQQQKSCFIFIMFILKITLSHDQLNFNQKYY